MNVCIEVLKAVKGDDGILWQKLLHITAYPRNFGTS